MPERGDEMIGGERRHPRSGRSDEIQVPRIQPQMSGVEAAATGTSAGGGGKIEVWQKYVDAANKLPLGKAREVLYEQARQALTTELNNAAMAGDDNRVAEIAGKLDQVYGLMEAKQGQAVKPGEASLSEINRQMEAIVNPPQFTDPKKLRAAAQRWLNQFRTATATGVTPDMVKIVEDVLNTDPRKAAEVEITEEDKLGIRAAMISYTGNLSANSEPEMSFRSFLNEQANRFGFGRHFEQKEEAELKEEFLARAELATVTAFWDGIAGSLNPDVDPYKEMTAGRIDNCRKLSRDTYMWLAKPKREMKYKSGEIKEVDDFRSQIDQSAKVLFDRINSGDINLWTTRGQDRINKIEELAKEVHLNEDAVRLAWQLAEAECWVATKNNPFLQHPAFRLVRFAEYRGFRSAQNMPVPGGMRLWVEKRGKSSGLPDSSVYNPEGEQFSKVGHESWFKFVPGTNDDGTPALDDAGKRKVFIMPDLQGGKAAVEGGQYLSTLYTLMTTNPDFSDIHLPQTEVMTSLVKGSAVFNSIEEVGKADPKQLSPKSLRSVRDSMVLALLRFKEGRGVPERMAAARVETGARLVEWSKTLLWLPSWDNPAHTDESTVMSTATWFELFQSVMTAYDGDKEWGEFIGFGMGEINERTNLAVLNEKQARDKTVVTKTRSYPTPAAAAAARNFEKWFEGNFYKHTNILRGKDKTRRPFMTKSRQNQDMIDLGKFDPSYWDSTRPAFFGYERRWWLKAK